MYFDVVDAKHVGDYRIELAFADGSRGTVDLSDYPDEANVFRRFLDVEYFKSFRIEYGSLVWGDDELDIAPEALYARATRKTVSYRES